MLRSFSLGTILLGAACAACTTAVQSDGPAIAYTGAPGTVQASFEQNVLRVRVSVNGSEPRTAVVDTGAPITAFDGTLFSDVNFVSGSAKTVALENGLTFDNVPAVSIDLCGAKCTADTLDGVFGANILRQFAASFDYQGGTFTLGTPVVPSTVDATGASIPFALEGGGATAQIQGSTTSLAVPATRVSVVVNIDGAELHMIVDSGASFVLLRPALFQAMIADGRRTLAVADETVSGTTKGQVARTQTITLGAATVQGAPAQTIDDSFVDGVATEVGHTVDGLLGGSFLREFFVTIDYHARAITLHRYANEDPLVDEFNRVGVELQTLGNTYAVAETIPGTNAAKSAPADLVGAKLIAVDKQPVAGLDAEQADRLLRGTIGDSHTLEYASASGANKSVTLKVEDVLPIP